MDKAIRKPRDPHGCAADQSSDRRLAKELDSDSRYLEKLAVEMKLTEVPCDAYPHVHDEMVSVLVSREAAELNP
jgi:hypothetical protein